MTTATTAKKNTKTKGKTNTKGKGGAGADDRRRARMRRYFKEVYDKRRRERYATDPAYRETIIRRARERYEERAAGEPKGYGSNAGRASAFAVEKKVYVSESSWDTALRRVLTKMHMAEFLGVGDNVFGNWVASGKFPEPCIPCVGGFYAYGIPEANKLARVLNRGMGNRRSFRVTDSALIESLHAASGG